MRNAFVLALSMLFLSQLAYPGFNYLYSINGNNSGDTERFFEFSAPSGLLAQDGRLYVADRGKNALYLMGGENRSVRERAIFRSSTQNPLVNPHRMHGENGTVYIADGISANIKYYNGEGFNLYDWNAKAGSNLLQPTAIAFDGEYAYITDSQRGMLYIYSRDFKSYLRVGIERGGSDGLLESPADIKIYNGMTYISDTAKKLIFAYGTNLTYQSAIGRAGGVALVSPRGFDIANDRIYVADANSNRVVVYTLDGYPIETLGGAEANFSNPEDVAVEGNRLYVADTLNRLVKVFEILPEGGNDTVMRQIAQANYSLGRLGEIQNVARRLNISVSEGNAGETLEQAVGDYERFLFASAANLAARAEQAADSERHALALEIDLAVKKLVKKSSDEVAPVRQKAPGLPALVQFDNSVSDIAAKLSSGQYSSAADSALALSSLADRAVSDAQSRTEEEQTAQYAKALATFESRFNALNSRLSTIRIASEQYRQQVNLTGLEALMASARDFAEDGDFTAANSSLSLAQEEIAAFEATVGGSSDGARAALANISLVELAINQSMLSAGILPPDLAQERLLIAQAKEAAYTNPELGLALAEQAKASSDVKIRESQAISLAAAALVGMLAVIGLVSVAFALHLRARKMGGHQGKDGGLGKKP